MKFFQILMSFLLLASTSCSKKKTEETEIKKPHGAKPTVYSKNAMEVTPENRGNPELKAIVASLPENLAVFEMPDVSSKLGKVPGFELFFVSSGHNAVMNSKCDGGGGIAHLATGLKENIKKEVPHLLFATGDTLGRRRSKREPLPVTKEEEKAAENILKVLGKLGFKAIFMGESDLHLGGNWIRPRAKAAGIQIISASGGTFEFEMMGKKAILAGLAESKFDRSSWEKNLKKWRTEKRPLIGAVVSGSIKFAKDLTTFAGGPDFVFISGSRSSTISRQFNNVPVIHAGSSFQFLGRVQFFGKGHSPFAGLESIGNWSAKLNKIRDDYTRTLSVLKKQMMHPTGKKFKYFHRRIKLILSDYDRLKKEVQDSEKLLSSGATVYHPFFVYLRDKTPDTDVLKLLGKAAEIPQCTQK
ncbi:hypothetical protein KKF34_14330 [Myxococcota bacterium]|nr:hypothetical protein [Myxococcota bacterium]MBU1380721.1 hypothetical protein [Myxococcota bacterium]MBU1498051.1 hypothetical protein [Myxococcota bacterium]